MRCTGGEGTLRLHSPRSVRGLPSLLASTRPSAAKSTACRSIARLRWIVRFSLGLPILPIRPGRDRRWRHLPLQRGGVQGPPGPLCPVLGRHCECWSRCLAEEVARAKQFIATRGEVGQSLRYPAILRFGRRTQRQQLRADRRIARRWAIA